MRARRKKGNKGYFGYKGHVGVNQETGIVHSARFTAANVHDSQEFDALLTGQEQAVFADKAYDSADRKRHFRRQGIYYGIMEKAHRNRPLSRDAEDVESPQEPDSLSGGTGVRSVETLVWLHSSPVCQSWPQQTAISVVVHDL
ncbi:MAG: transposase [candidate division KSB1 bacterium]|nr:transposase [candidate division KSB1 bacterium]